MSVYLLTYDLKGGDHNYSDLYKLLNEETNATHPFESVWFLDSGYNSKDLYEIIESKLHSDKDTIFLVKIRLYEDCIGKMPQQSVQWLKSTNRTWDGLK